MPFTQTETNAIAENPLYDVKKLARKVHKLRDFEEWNKDARFLLRVHFINNKASHVIFTRRRDSYLRGKLFTVASELRGFHLPDMWIIAEKCLRLGQQSADGMIITDADVWEAILDLVENHRRLESTLHIESPPDPQACRSREADAFGVESVGEAIVNQLRYFPYRETADVVVQDFSKEEWDAFQWFDVPRKDIEDENDISVASYGEYESPIPHVLPCRVLPQGRVLKLFRDPKELLWALRDATLLHLEFVNRGLLHRNISSHSIIIPEPGKQFLHAKGMLIQLDMAAAAHDMKSRRHWLGNVEFMSHRVLSGEQPTFLDDLESFLYVLIRLCAHEAWTNRSSDPGEQPPCPSWAHKWRAAQSPQGLAGHKRGLMTDINKFDELMERFPRLCWPIKPVCREIRFALQTANPQRGHMETYDKIDQAYRYGLECYEGEEFTNLSPWEYPDDKYRGEDWVDWAS